MRLPVSQKNVNRPALSCCKNLNLYVWRVLPMRQLYPYLAAIVQMSSFLYLNVNNFMRYLNLLISINKSPIKKLYALTGSKIMRIVLLFISFLNISVYSFGQDSTA